MMTDSNEYMMILSQAMVVACEHLDVISATRLASCNKELWSDVKPRLDQRPELLPKRVIMVFLKELQPHLISEYQMPTTLLMSVDDYWQPNSYSRYPDRKERIMRVVDARRVSRLRIKWSLDKPNEFELFFRLPWRPSWTIMVQPS